MAPYNKNLNHPYRSEETGGLFSSPLPFAIALLAVGLVIFGAWYFFFSSPKMISNQSIPLIEAENEPVKIRPDNSVQPEVPHKDKLVYGRVNPAEQKGSVERLLPPPEEPIDPETLNIKPSPQSPPSDMTTATDIKSDAHKPIEMKVESDTFPAAEPQVPPQKIQTDQLSTLKPSPSIPNLQPQEMKKPDTTEAGPAQQVTQVVPQKGLKAGYRVQLASMKSPEQAQSEWKRISGQYGSALSGCTPHFARVDLGAQKGIYYRVQVGDFETKDQAENICRQIRDKNPQAGCLIIRF